jgi:Rad3-related DNA helicase
MNDTYNNLKNIYSKFTEKTFRPQQESTIDFLCNSDARIRIIQASTGFGKSLVGMITGAYYGQFTYLVSSKQLQDQLESDFPEVVVMKGRNNYSCTKFPMLSAAECLHTSQDPCKYKHVQCPYESAKKRAMSAKYRVLNYHYFLNEVNYVGKFSENTLLICDEADLLEFLLTDFICLKIPGKLIKELNIKYPKYKTTQSENALEEWSVWAETEAKPKISNELSKVEDEISMYYGNGGDDIKKLIRKKQQLSGAIERLNIFLTHVDDDWLYEESTFGQNKKYKDYPTITFKPTWLTESLAHNYFFSHSRHVIFMSATFPPRLVMSKLFGCPPDQFQLKDIPSPYAIENRKIILNPAADMTYKKFDKEVYKLIEKIKEIISKHKNQKGIIHTVSYKLNKLIVDTINNPRLITHDNKNRAEVIDRFKYSDKPLILVSPSITRGVDFPAEQCEFQICAKAPFKSLGDKLTNSRVHSSKIGNLWYKAITAQEVIQSCGRGVRSSTDKCITYMLDKQICDLILDNRKLFPGYFLDAIDI